MNNFKSPNFGTLVINAINNSGRSRHSVFSEFSEREHPNHEQFSDTALIGRSHHTAWCIRVCEVLRINADEAYAKILQDKGLSEYDDGTLIKLAPKAYLIKYQFMGLRFRQLLQEIQELENTNTDSEVIKSKIAECRRIQNKQSRMTDLLNSIGQLKPNQREMLRLRFFEGLVVPEIANRLGYVKRSADYVIANGLKIFSEYGAGALKRKLVVYDK